MIFTVFNIHHEVCKLREYKSRPGNGPVVRKTVIIVQNKDPLTKLLVNGKGKELFTISNISNIFFNYQSLLENIYNLVPALLVHTAVMKVRQKRRKAKPKYRQRNNLKSFRKHEDFQNLFVASGCYFTDAWIGCLHRQIELDIEMYWYGMKRRNHAILTHARRHFIKLAYKHWPRVASQVIMMLFHDPRFALMGDLKEFAVRVARDHLCLDRKHRKLRTTMLKSMYLWKGREFRSMLQEELEHSWISGKLWTHPPPNTWYNYEEKYRMDLAGMNRCKSRY